MRLPAALPQLSLLILSLQQFPQKTLGTVLLFARRLMSLQKDHHLLLASLEFL